MTTAVKKEVSPAIHVLRFMLLAAAVAGTGALFGYLGGADEGYSGLVRPAFMPPDITFSIVWPVLYFMMAASLYFTLIETPTSAENALLRKTSIALFFVQLLVNVTWPLIFFKARLFFFAFIWLALLDALVVALITINTRVNKWSAWLLVPYLLWILFATVLNIAIAIYN